MGLNPDAAATYVAAVVARLVAMCTGHANTAVLVKHAAAFCTYRGYDALQTLPPPPLLLLLLLQVNAAQSRWSTPTGPACYLVLL
jgi:hypothetical protein